MSLIKTVKSANGAVAEYHRIGNINKNGSILNITINSYTDESYREMEKRLADFQVEKDNLISELSILSSKAKNNMTDQETARQEEIQSLFNQMRILSSQGKCSLFETIISIESANMINISFQDIYHQLKNESEIFRNAIDC